VGLSQLKELSGLSHLYLWTQVPLEATAVESLRSALPKTRIHC